VLCRARRGVRHRVYHHGRKTIVYYYKTRKRRRRPHAKTHKQTHVPAVYRQTGAFRSVNFCPRTVVRARFGYPLSRLSPVRGHRAIRRSARTASLRHLENGTRSRARRQSIAMSVLVRFDPASPNVFSARRFADLSVRRSLFTAT